jgi:hypothetical protein
VRQKQKRMKVGRMLVVWAHKVDAVGLVAHQDLGRGDCKLSYIAWQTHTISRIGGMLARFKVCHCVAYTRKSTKFGRMLVVGAHKVDAVELDTHEDPGRGNCRGAMAVEQQQTILKQVDMTAERHLQGCYGSGAAAGLLQLGPAHFPFNDCLWFCACHPKCNRHAHSRYSTKKMPMTCP